MRRFQPAALIALMVIILTAFMVLLGYIESKAQEQAVDTETWSTVKAMFRDQPDEAMEWTLDVLETEADSSWVYQTYSKHGERITWKCFEVNGWTVCVSLERDYIDNAPIEMPNEDLYDGIEWIDTIGPVERK